LDPELCLAFVAPRIIKLKLSKTLPYMIEEREEVKMNPGQYEIFTMAEPGNHLLIHPGSIQKELQNLV
jgi:hypothetical protein